MRIRVVIACEKCQRRNYTVSKNKVTHPERLVLTKHCKWCKTHTEHRETR